MPLKGALLVLGSGYSRVEFQNKGYLGGGGGVGRVNLGVKNQVTICRMNLKPFSGLSDRSGTCLCVSTRYVRYTRTRKSLWARSCMHMCVRVCVCVCR